MDSAVQYEGFHILAAKLGLCVHCRKAVHNSLYQSLCASVNGLTVGSSKGGHLWLHGQIMARAERVNGRSCNNAHL